MAGIRDLSPEDAQREIAAQPGNQDDPHIYGDIPSTFDVSGSKGRVLSTGETMTTENWNFDDAKIGSGGPIDLAALEYSSNFAVSKTSWNLYDYQNQGHRGDAHIYSASPNNGTTVLPVDDKTSNFYTSFDHGSLTAYGKPSGSPSYSFQYEHNQGGGSLSDVSVSLGVLTVSYSGEELKGQKSTGVLR